MIGDPGLGDWFIPPEIDEEAQAEPEKITGTKSSYELYFPEDWDRYLFDLEGKSYVLKFDNVDLFLSNIKCR